MSGSASLDDLLARLAAALDRLDELGAGVREEVYAALDAVDDLHRTALRRLGDVLGPDVLDELRRADDALGWLLDTYGVGADQRAAAEAALEQVRPYISSHGGHVDLLDVEDGVVRLGMGGACAGCTASAVTLQEGVERALAEHMPGFVRMEVAEDTAPPHPPPGATLLQIRPRPPER